MKDKPKPISEGLSCDRETLLNAGYKPLVDKPDELVPTAKEIIETLVTLRDCLRKIAKWSEYWEKKKQ